MVIVNQMDATLCNYFSSRLRQIARSSSPTTFRWTNLDRLYMGFLLDGRGHQGTGLGGERVLSHIAAMYEECLAADEWVAAFIQWENALSWPERYTWGLKVDLMWERLVTAVEHRKAIEGL